MPYTLPDLAGVARAYLAGHPDVDALVDSRVYVLRTPASPTFPLVLLTSVVETPLVARTDKLAATELQVECYGADAFAEYAARTLAATCHAALLDLPGSDGVTEVSTVTGLQPVPDRELDRARWLFDVRIVGVA